MLGSHLSIAGGMVNALDEADRLGMDCVQVFTKNQRRWTAPPLDDATREAWLERLDAMGWADPADLRSATTATSSTSLRPSPRPGRSRWPSSERRWIAARR